MQIEVEINGVRRQTTSQELFQYAASGAIGPKTRIWIDGKETTCENVKGITFGTQVDDRATRQSTGPDDPRVVKTPYLNYFVGGQSYPYLICYLENGGSVFSSAGGRVWMKGPINTQAKATGGVLKSLGRALTGETFFMSEYEASGDAEVAFATKMPGQIVPKLLAAGESLVCQKRAFLAGSKGIKIEIFFQKKIGAGFFGGEGFIMQKVTGPGIVFLEIDGSAFNYTLGAGETVRCDTGALAWMDPTCSIEIKLVQGGLKGVFFGGEGLFDTIVTGPGRATFQTTNFNNLLQSVASPRK